MVYCGKPSTGCDACRARRVKCDQTRPACIRCTRIRRVCPGYRDISSVLFRDETRSVARKAKSAASSGPNSPSASASCLVPQSSAASNASTGSLSPTGDMAEAGPLADKWSSRRIIDEGIPLIPRNPFKTDQKLHATCFFFDSFAWIYSGVIQRCDPSGDASSPSTPLAQRALTNAVTSVGMANLSSIQRSKPLRIAAWREYADALKWTNAAISDRTQATEDATFAAILCLSMFEIITCKKRESMADFVQHTNGALALLSLRGDSQLEREEGLRLFFALRNEVMIGCILKRYPFPRQLITLSEQVTRLPGATPSTQIGYQLTCIMADVCDLRIAHQEKLKIIDTELLSRSLALDSRIDALESTFPPEAMYESVTVTTPRQTFQVVDSLRISPLDACYHIYGNWMVPNMWNIYRYSRMLVNEVILNQLKLMIMATHPSAAAAAPPTSDFKRLCYRSRDLVRKFARDVCASVPYVLGLVNESKASTKSAAGHMTIMFPLYIAASVDGPGSEMCRWVQDCFTKLGRGMGIDQALILVDLLDQEDSMTAFVDALHELDLDGPGEYEQGIAPVNEFYAFDTPVHTI